MILRREPKATSNRSINTKHQIARLNVSLMFLSDCWPSAPEHNVVVIPEREKEPDWKTGDHNINGNRNRSRCYNGSSKSEAPKCGPSAESPLKQNGAPPVSLVCCFTNGRFGVCLTGFVDARQACVPLVFDGSAQQTGTEYASPAQTPAAPQAAWGPAEGAGAAGAAPAAWRETETQVPEVTPALPHQEKVNNDWQQK